MPLPENIVLFRKYVRRDLRFAAEVLGEGAAFADIPGGREQDPERAARMRETVAAFLFVDHQHGARLAKAKTVAEIEEILTILQAWEDTATSRGFRLGLFQARDRIQQSLNRKPEV